MTYSTQWYEYCSWSNCAREKCRDKHCELCKSNPLTKASKEIHIFVLSTKIDHQSSCRLCSRATKFSGSIPLSMLTQKFPLKLVTTKSIFLLNIEHCYRTYFHMSGRALTTFHLSGKLQSSHQANCSRRRKRMRQSMGREYLGWACERHSEVLLDLHNRQLKKKTRKKWRCHSHTHSIATRCSFKVASYSSVILFQSVWHSRSIFFKF